MDMGKTQLLGNAATLIVGGNISLTINIARSVRVIDFNDIKQILILVADSALKNCV